MNESEALILIINIDLIKSSYGIAVKSVVYFLSQSYEPQITPGRLSYHVIFNIYYLTSFSDIVQKDFIVLLRHEIVSEKKSLWN